MPISQLSSTDVTFCVTQVVKSVLIESRGQVGLLFSPLDVQVKTTSSLSGAPSRSILHLISSHFSFSLSHLHLISQPSPSQSKSQLIWYGSHLPLSWSQMDGLPPSGDGTLWLLANANMDDKATRSTMQWPFILTLRRNATLNHTLNFYSTIFPHGIVILSICLIVLTRL